MNSTDLLSTAKYFSDHAVLRNGIVLSYLESSVRIGQLQKTYGSGNVIYCPPVCSVYEKERTQSRRVSPIINNAKLILIYGPNVDEVSDRISLNLMKHLVSKYGNVHQINLRKVVDYESCMEALENISDYNPSLVFAVYPNEWICSIVLSFGIPFCFLNPQIQEYRNFLKEQDMYKFIIQTTDYNHLKMLFFDIHVSIGQNPNIVKDGFDRIRRNYSVAMQQVKTMKKEVDNYKRDNVIRLPFCFLNTVHRDVSDLQPVLEKMRPYGDPKGIVFDVAVVLTFVEGRKYSHLYHWVGLIEVSNKGDLELLFSNENFLHSLKFCQGLFYVHPDIGEFLRNKVRKTGKRILVQQLPLFYWECDDKFSVELWEQNPYIFIRSADTMQSLPINNLNSSSTNSSSIDYNPSTFSDLCEKQVFIMSKKDVPLVGYINTLLSKKTPIIVQKDTDLGRVLKDYPLLVERSTVSAVSLWITPQLVTDGIKFLSNGQSIRGAIVPIKQFMRTIMSSKIYTTSRILMSLLD